MQGHGKKKKAAVRLNKGEERRSSGVERQDRRRSSGAKYAAIDDDAAAADVDVNRVTMWCTAWVGGIPAEFVKSSNYTSNPPPNPHHYCKLQNKCYLFREEIRLKMQK